MATKFEKGFNQVEQKNEELETVERDGKLYTLHRERKTKRTSLVMRQSTFDKLEDRAATLGTSRNDLLNEIIEDYLKDK